MEFNFNEYKNDKIRILRNLNKNQKVTSNKFLKI